METKKLLDFSLFSKDTETELRKNELNQIYEENREWFRCESIINDDSIKHSILKLKLKKIKDELNGVPINPNNYSFNYPFKIHNPLLDEGLDDVEADIQSDFYRNLLEKSKLKSFAKHI